MKLKRLQALIGLLLLIFLLLGLQMLGLTFVQGREMVSRNDNPRLHEEAQPGVDGK